MQHFRLSKREKFLIVTFVLTGGVLATQLVSLDNRVETVIGLFLGAYLLSAWALREDLNGIEWVTLLLLPALYTASISLFYFLLPVRWLTRLPTIVFFAIGMYALLLTENIYNVAAERSIQLVRAAHSVGLLLTLVTNFFFFNTLLALHLPSWQNAIGACIISMPLSLQALWSVTISEKTISSRIWLYTLTIAIVISQMTFFLSFWPVKGIVAALFLTSVLYVLLGFGQQRLLDRLFTTVIRELILVGCLVFVLMLFATRWGA